MKRTGRRVRSVSETLVSAVIYSHKPLSRTVVALLLPIFLLLRQSALAQAEFNYLTNDDGTITITGYSWTMPPESIPSKINDLLVTGIGDSAFYNCGSFTNVIIPDSVTTIGDNAFSSCFNLTNIVIPDSVTNLGGYAFYTCQSLINVTIGSNITSIGESTFNNCSSLISVILPDAVTNIENSAFWACITLTNITIPGSVRSIGYGAFFYCTNLTAITVDDANPSYSSADGILFDKDQTTLIQCPARKTGAYTIPASVNNIKEMAFNGCSGLSGITIPGSVTNIGNYAFSYCTTLTAIAVDALNSNYCSVDGVLFNRSQTALIQYPPAKPAANYTISNTVNSIGTAAFASCTNLTRIAIPDSVTFIGDQAFDMCTGLNSLMIPDSVTVIGFAAFEACIGLRDITIPDTVTTIGDATFNICTGLTNVTIGNGVTTIGFLMFASCSSLASVTLPDSVKSIANNAFYYDTTLANATIGNSVTNIGYDAFYGCSSLREVFFRGNAPGLVAPWIFDDNAHVVVYYLPGTTGWQEFAVETRAPVVLWNPQFQIGDGSFGIRSNGFCFNITGTTNILIVLEAASSLTGGSWTVLQNCTLTNGSVYFSDPGWTNYPSRFYRIRSP